MNKGYGKLINAAKSVMKRSYSPYSGFKVGAALLTAGGKIFSGTNVENCSYGLAVCAERAAVSNAVSEGEKRFKAIAIASSEKGFCYPCGACLQVLAEFALDLDIILTDGPKIKTFKLKELLPSSFKSKK